MTEDPLFHVAGLEAQMPPDLQERNTSLADQSPHEPFTYAKSFCDLADVDQLVGCRRHTMVTGLATTERGNPMSVSRIDDVYTETTLPVPGCDENQTFQMADAQGSGNLDACDTEACNSI